MWVESDTEIFAKRRIGGAFNIKSGIEIAKVASLDTWGLFMK